jgi:2-hydroxy-3-oxopropionate reductase
VAHSQRAGVDRLIARGATEVATASAAARQTQMAVLVLPTSDDVEAVIFGANGVAEGMPPGYIVIDMGTGYPVQTRRLAAQLSDRHARFLDAPITGGVKGAKEGTLAIMVGGDAGVLETVRPVLNRMGSHIYHFGEVGAGHTAKLVQNMISIMTYAALAEGYVLAAAAGLDVEKVYEMMAAVPAASPTLKSMMPKVLKRAFKDVTFRLDLVHKDIRQASQLGRELAVPLPTTNGAIELLELARALGFGAEDQTAVIRGLETIRRVEVKGHGA